MTLRNPIDVDPHRTVFRRSLFRLTVLMVGFGSGVGMWIQTPVVAQRPSSPRTRLGVDEVTLASGKKMYGVVMDRSQNGDLTLVVERKWFEDTYPGLYKAQLTSEIRASAENQKILLQRLEAWKKDRFGDKELVEFIDEEIARISERKPEQASADVAKKRFTSVLYSAQDIKSVFIQTPERRHVVGCAWKHDIERASSRTTAALERELKKKGIDITQETFDFSDQIASNKTQSEFEWCARVALFEFVLRKKLEYQGSGSTLIRMDEDNPPKAGDLLGQLLGGGLNLGGLNGGVDALNQGGLIDELLNELNASGTPNRNRANRPEWWKKTTDDAARDGFRGVKITRVDTNFNSPVAKVEIFFLARMDNGNWKLVASFSASANRNQQAAEDMARIKGDPQVQKILGVLSGLGLGGNENLIDTAIRQGAATEQAMQLCEQKFLEFVDRFTVRIDSPPLPVK